MKAVLFTLFLLLPFTFMSWGDETSAFYEAPTKSEKKIQPEYEACKDTDLSSLSFSEEKDSKKKTEGEFCFSCLISKAFSFGEMKQTSQATQSKVFREKLQKQVIGQIQSKIYQTQLIRNCILEKREWFSKQKDKVDWGLRKAVCRQQTKALRSSIREHWTQMRVNLALSSPAIDEGRVLSKSVTWMDTTPSHLISDFNDLPKLTKKEKEKARKLYVETLYFQGTEGCLFLLF